MKQFSAATILICACAFVLAAPQGAEWFKVAPVGAGFSVMMPARPNEELKSNNDLTIHLFTLTIHDAIYMVSYGDYAPALQIEVEDQLNANRDSFARDLNAKIVDTRKIKMNGHPGIEFTAISDRATIKSRIYLFGNRVHQITIAALDAQTETEDAKRFFSSFTFTTKP